MEENHSVVVDRYMKDIQKVKSSFRIVEGIRDQLVEENRMLQEQVVRYTDII